MLHAWTESEKGQITGIKSDSALLVILSFTTSGQDQVHDHTLGWVDKAGNHSPRTLLDDIFLPC